MSAEEQITARPTDRKTAAELIRQHDMAALKRFGQNFLTDDAVVDGIVQASSVSEEDAVLEIGPGLGALTLALSEAAGRVVAVEIDKGMAKLLRTTLADRSNVSLVEGDILKTDLRALSEAEADGAAFRVVANLPYYITTPVLMKLLQKDAPVDTVTVMVQKEVAERMCAQPGNRAYGALSLAVQYYAAPQIVLEVPSSAFLPRPKVESAVVHLRRYDMPPVTVSDEALLFDLIRAAFRQRRKTLVNAASQIAPKQVLARELNRIGKNETVRGETLSLSEFAALADGIADDNRG